MAKTAPSVSGLLASASILWLSDLILGLANLVITLGEQRPHDAAA
jgi:hypothetical protein